MAKSVFSKKYTNRLLTKLNKERRSQLEVEKKGQVIILADVKELELAISQVYPDLKVPKPKLIRALKKGRTKAKELQKRVSARKFNAINNKLNEVLPSNLFRLGVNVFVIHSFSSAKTIKEAMLDSLVAQKAITKDAKAAISPKLHRGHGVQGEAVSQVEIASTAAGMTPQEIEVLQAGINRFAEIGEITGLQAEEINKLITRHDMIVTKSGALKATYFSILNFQHEKGNLDDKTDEKNLKQAYRKFLKEVSPDLLNLEGSSTMKEKTISFIGQKIEESVKTNKNISVSYKKAELSTGSVTEAKGSKKKKARMSKKRQGPISVRNRNKGVASSPLHLFMSLNAQLPAVLQKNMKDPRLNYRSGRFANSVRITNVDITPKGFPSVGYTYMKYPYQTFEPGYAQGDLDRDPRRLIDSSIRELAIQFAVGRFYTRRV
jgi:hypothetical protein